MNLGKDLVKLFESEPLFQAVVEGTELFIFANGINYVHVPPFQKLTLSAAVELSEMVIQFYEGRDVHFCNIIKFESAADLDPKAREWGASRPARGATSISDAIIISSAAHRIIANFYMKINRPKKPTKFFNDLESSIAWSNEQLEKRKQR